MAEERVTRVSAIAESINRNAIATRMTAIVESMSKSLMVSRVNVYLELAEIKQTEEDFNIQVLIF